ncbi:terpenoid synthase [Dichomitus squalens]|uniref:Terpene synthase n=1 Tax=Dichomitus squalens TaxID=114155 RepID=A0A4V2K7A8_9APHY|nr:terpenoid synthase [Dichomitus squalens]
MEVTYPPKTFHLPETMAGWPLPRRLNVFYGNVSYESANWIRDFHAFSSTAQRAFDKCNFGLLAALAYPTQSRDQYRSACDLMNLFFVFDEYTDALNEAGTQTLAEISMDAMINPPKPRPEKESVVGEISRQFWNRVIEHATPTCQARLRWSWERFVYSVVEQARDREGGRLRTVEEHMAIRRLTIGAEPCYALAEMELEIPREVYDHPVVHGLRADITDIIIYDNDLASYKKEQASGDDLHNIITITMHENNLDLDGALQWVAARHKERFNHALATWPRALSLTFSPQVDRDLACYLDHLMNWPRANDCWNFENGRYFGTEGLQIQKHRAVMLLQKRSVMK